MNESKKHCPRCERELKPDAPSGLCPACLMEINLQSGLSQPASGGRVVPLPVEEVARRFPEMEILGLLGSGGMGAVYKARQLKLDRLVALKILSHEREDAGFIERFTREAQTLAKLNHPNIVAVYEFGQRGPEAGSRRREEAEGEGGGVAGSPPPDVGGYKEEIFFLIMELVDGVTLRDLLSEGRLKPEQALAIVPPICDALQFAHEKGVVHRDIKPENILMDKAGVVKVADFGIARMAGADRGQNLTGKGQVVGTAHYMAPEQVERPAEVDHRADIYALGVVFYEMLTGELPLGRFPEPSKKVQIDVRLDEVVLKALEKNPEQRYQQASEVKTRVETLGAAEAFKPAAAKSDAANLRRRVKAPAVGLIIFGGLHFFVATVGSAPRVGSVMLAVWVLGACVMIYGGRMMLKMQSYPWAVAGAVAAMVTLVVSEWVVVGIPLGLWALLVLVRSDVQTAFPRAGRDHLVRIWSGKFFR